MQTNIKNIYQICDLVIRLRYEIWQKNNEIIDLQKLANSLELTDKDDIETLKNINTY